MYDVNAVKRMVLKHGVDYLISYLMGDLDKRVEAELTKVHLIVNGYPNLTLIYSLA